MRLIENVRISSKIVAVLALLGAITLLISWNGSRRLMATNTDYSALIATTMPDATRLSRASRSVTSMMYSAYRTILYDGRTPQAREAYAEEQKGFGDAKTRLAEVVAAEPHLSDQMASFRTRVEEIHRYTGAATEAGLANRDDEGRRLMVEADIKAKAFIADSLALNQKLIAIGQNRSDELTRESIATSRSLIVMGIVAMIVGVGLGILVSRFGIIRPLHQLQEQMGRFANGDYREEVVGIGRGDEIGAMAKAVQVFRENGIAKEASDKAKARADAEQKMVVDTVSLHLSELSDGDLTKMIEREFPTEYATLRTNFNNALARLRTLIASVSESAATIRTGSGEIAQASEDLARRTESSAASLEETAASVTQMDGRLRASASAATRTVERADQAIETVGGGRAVADEAVQAMGRVSESAKGIDDVIEGLDKIAFQTRVLAMNAAVEAGRAGDAGRGFAVVADLVSALAMRAEEEAKRARDQLTVTQTDIVTAVEAVQKVDGALADISGDVTQVHTLLATMAADNQAQSAAITQISAAIATMDQSTQQNAAMVEQTSAAARNLASEIGGLNEQANRFKVDDDGRDWQAAPKRSYTTPASYASPIKPLPAAAIAALTHPADDWNSF